MRVLVACEFSGIVRDAFRERGHDAWSCDLLPCEDNSPFHLRGRVESVGWEEWDLMVAHPPCTYLAVSGARWFKGREKEQQLALQFVKYLMDAPIPKIAIENPIGIISTRIRKPDQIIQPWQFGHEETKSTCLWLKNLPILIPTSDLRAKSQERLSPINELERRDINLTSSGQNKIAPSPDRWKIRSRTYQGIADAMASQWG